jgi:hypothetical protein
MRRLTTSARYTIHPVLKSFQQMSRVSGHILIVTDRCYRRMQHHRVKQSHPREQGIRSIRMPSMWRGWTSPSTLDLLETAESLCTTFDTKGSGFYTSLASRITPGMIPYSLELLIWTAITAFGPYAFVSTIRGESNLNLGPDDENLAGARFRIRLSFIRNLHEYFVLR